MAKWYDNPVGQVEVGEHRDRLPATAKGRGAGMNPGNRHEKTRVYLDGEYLDAIAAGRPASDTDDDDAADGGMQVPSQESAAPLSLPVRQTPTQVMADQSRSILNRIDMPDLHFRWTMNPYRGCEHGCIYCYARPDHERLGFSAGLDFETRIMVKHEAPALLRQALAKPTWQGEGIMLAGDTDCYQPLERELRITRQCLTVMAEARQAVSIVTKSRLVTRDLDLLTELAAHGAVHVAVSVTTLDARLAARMEPRASAPRERLETIRRLREAGVPVVVMVAPVVPGLTDREMAGILEAAAEAGAQGAGYVMLRLPYQVKALFEDWLQRHEPGRAGHVTSLLRQMHGGKLYDASVGVRQRGTGPFAAQVSQLFRVATRRLGLVGQLPALNTQAFRRPRTDAAQAFLFEP